MNLVNREDFIISYSKESCIYNIKDDFSPAQRKSGVIIQGLIDQVKETTDIIDSYLNGDLRRYFSPSDKK